MTFGCVAQTGFQFMIFFLPQYPQCWDYRSILYCLTICDYFKPESEFESLLLRIVFIILQTRSSCFLFVTKIRACLYPLSILHLGTSISAIMAYVLFSYHDSL